MNSIPFFSNARLVVNPPIPAPINVYFMLHVFDPEGPFSGDDVPDPLGNKDSLYWTKPNR